MWLANNRFFRTVCAALSTADTLRALGADYVFDVTFSADLTIMEEGSELLSRILKGTGPLPQFTSCCPA